MEHTYMYKKKTLILKATYILAVQMLKFISSFYWLYKALNTHHEYKSTVHVHVKAWYRKMSIFVVLCFDETYYYFICVIINVISLWFDFWCFNATFSSISSISAANRVHPFYNLQSRARTHSVLVIGLYELLELLGLSYI